MQFFVYTFHTFKPPLEAVASILSSELSAIDRISVRWPGISTADARL